MKLTFAVCFATLYGLSVRLLFGFLDNLLGIMSISFIFLTPFIIGFLTVILSPSENVKSKRKAFAMPWMTSFVILIITILLNIEGTICWIMIFPIFGILAGIGGIVAHFWRNRNASDKEQNDWQDPNTVNISFILFVPVLLGVVESDRSLTQKNYNLSESIIIEASPEVVWHELTHINTINHDENKFSLTKLIGFPSHIATTLDTAAIGGKRKATYENGLYFDETIVKYENEKLLVLDIKTDPYNIPPTVMDEHIVIGGKHVDILQDTYQLEKLSDNSCRLTLSSRFFINTPFNWYTGIWAECLMSDILSSELRLVQQRATKK